MFNIFRKQKQVELRSPFEGEAIKLTEVPDEAFSSGLVGDGIAFLPHDGTIYSPADGEIVQVFPSKHAICMRTEEGLEVLIHIGIDTVKMKGEGFESFVSPGSKVNAGEKLMSFDINLIKENAKSIVSPFIITNMEAVASMKWYYGDAHMNSTVAVVTLK